MATPKTVNIAIAGATGAVGQEMLAILEKTPADRLPIGELRLLASARSDGKSLTFRGKPLTVRTLAADVFAGIDYALFSAGSARSKEFAGPAQKAGATVIDNSSAFRMDAAVPLIIPEVNGDALDIKATLVANPNCTAITALMAVGPIHRAIGVTRMIAASYQAVSGAGMTGITALEREVARKPDTHGNVAGGRDPESPFKRQIAYNVIPQVDVFDDTGWTYEERKFTNEVHKILGASFPIQVTCVRVPVLRAHSEAVTCDLAKPATKDQILAVLRAAPGLTLHANDAEFPTAIDTSGGDVVRVGRVRVTDKPVPSVTFWVVGDQLRKGAAQNAVQIAEHLFAKRG
jgi:aspartate-semialdehyde dehydrogenase